MNQLWALFIVVLVPSFAVLGWIGKRIHEEMPPIPARGGRRGLPLMDRRHRAGGGERREGRRLHGLQGRARERGRAADARQRARGDRLAVRDRALA